MALGKLLLAGTVMLAAYAAFSARQPKAVQSFAEPTTTAIDRLRVKRRVVNGTGLGSLTIESAGSERGALLIGVTRAGEARTVKCRVTISSLSERESRAATDCTQPAIANQPMGRLGDEALAVVMREHVAATIEDRRYDIDSVADRMMAIVVMNGPVIAASLSAAKR
jgi:hypothetical protein